MILLMPPHSAMKAFYNTQILDSHNLITSMGISGHCNYISIADMGTAFSFIRFQKMFYVSIKRKYLKRNTRMKFISISRDFLKFGVSKAF